MDTPPSLLTAGLAILSALLYLDRRLASGIELGCGRGRSAPTHRIGRCSGTHCPCVSRLSALRRPASPAWVSIALRP